MKRKDILSILIPSFIFVIAWIILSIHHNVVTSTISEQLNMQITAISPSFDTSVITSLTQRQNILPTYGLVTPSTQSAIITPIPTPTAVISSDSAKIATLEGSLSQ